MTRRLVFAGGIQAKALAKAYRLDAATDRDEDVFFIGAESMAREAAHRVIAAADVIVTEITAGGEAVPETLVPARAMVIGVPLVRGDFLWPFAGRPHPANRSTDALPDGPYPADFGDSHLDALLAQGVSADDAVARYMDLDVASEVDLDALLQRVMDDQTALDVRAGSSIADFVRQGFRSQDLFATRDRMHLPLFRHVAERVFDQLGADPMRAAGLTDTQFLPGAMPIHPSVLGHFGIERPSDHRYPVLDEGVFTFEEYCHRYVRFVWNEQLHAALALAEINPSEAIPALRAALEESPGSQAGQRALELAERAVLEISLLPAPQNTAEPPMKAAVAQTALAPVALPQGEVTAGYDHPGPGVLPTSPGLSWPTAADATGKLPFLRAGDEPVASPDYEPLDAAPEQQSYVELPLAYSGHDAPLVEERPAAPNRYTPLAPSQELIEVLPRMLPSTRGLAGASEGPFSMMPESMPPPPLRPVLPPEFRPEPPRRGLIAKLFGQGK